MQPPKGSGLEVIDKLVRRSIDFYADALKSEHFRKSILPSAIKVQPIRLPSLDELKRPVQSLINSFNSAVTQLTAKPEKIDYNAVVNSFLPPGAKLLKPQYPENSNEIEFEDLDADKRGELVTSFRTNDGIRTLILKRDNVQWYKMAEISSPEFDDIVYRNSADIAGDGKKYLLLGLVSKSHKRVLYAYSLADGSTRKIFSKNYDKMELLKTRTASGSVKDAIAFWNEDTGGTYDTELVHWNGIDLENLNQARYLNAKVIPYHIRKLRHNQNDIASWYNLANSLSKAGNKTGAARAIELGLERNPGALMQDRFNELKSKL